MLDKTCPNYFQTKPLPALGLLLLRLVVGTAFIFHGLPKISAPFNWMGADASMPGFLQMLAALSEFGGGIALILGFLTPLALLGLIATMKVAILAVHVPAGHPFVSGGGGPSYELALIYLVIFVLLLLNSPGKYSLDYFLSERFCKHSET